MNLRLVIRNVVRIASVGRSSGTGPYVEFLDGALNNYVCIDSVETGATDSSALVSDASAGSTNVFEFSRLPNRQNLTIASDAIALAHGKIEIVRLDTEASAASDNLATINGGADGQVIVLTSTNNLRDVTVKNGTGNIKLDGGADFTLDSASDTLTLVYSSNVTAWLEISRANDA